MDLVPVTVYEATKKPSLSEKYRHGITGVRAVNRTKYKHILVGTIAVYINENNNVVLRT